MKTDPMAKICELQLQLCSLHVLLGKYINHVTEAEGIDFIDYGGVGLLEELTEEDRKILRWARDLYRKEHWQ